MLIGASAYCDPGLNDLPAVTNNLTRLGELLMDHEVWGLPEERCIRVPEPTTLVELLDPIDQAVRAATDTLFVYFAGHGLIHPTAFDTLLLALPTTDPRRPYTAVDYVHVRDVVGSSSSRVNRLVVLDCCYAGRASGGGMNGSIADVALTEQAKIGGAYLLTACAPTRQAQAPPGETYTAFTGELIRLLEQGLPGGKPFIEVTEAYEHLHRELRAKNRPLPQQRLDNSERSLVLARNRYRRPPPTSEASEPPYARRSAGWPPRPAAPEAPAELNVPIEWEDLLRSRPRVVLDAVARMEDEARTDEAQELLLLLSKLRPVQEVAMLVVLLNRRPGRLHFSRTVSERARRSLRPQPYLSSMTRVVVYRGPASVVEYVQALNLVNEARGEVDQACRTAAVDLDVDDVAHTVKALSAAGFHSEAGAVVRFAATDPQSMGRVVPLAGALWSTGMDADADRLLEMVTANSPEQALELGGEMLALGRHHKAFELYLKAATVIAHRPASEAMRVLSAMDQASDDDLAEPFLRAVVTAAPLPDRICGLCEELSAAGMADRALIVLDEAATHLTVDGTLELAGSLCEGNRGESAVHLLNAAALAQPIGTATHRFADFLLDFGRPTDAMRLLTGILDRSAADAAVLLASLWRSQRHEDVDRMLAALARRWHRYGVYRALFNSSGVDEELKARVARMPQGELVAFLRKLRERPTGTDTHALVAVLKAVADERPDVCARLILRLAQAELRTEAAILACLSPNLDDTRPLADTQCSWGPRTDEVQKLLTGPWPDMAQHAYTLAALSAVGQEKAVLGSLAGFARGRRVSQVVSFLQVLDQQDLTSCAQAVIKQVDSRECFDPLVRRLSWAGLRPYAILAINTLRIKTLPTFPDTRGRPSRERLDWLLDDSRPSVTPPDPYC
ncbi:caspase family protein [Streptomyces phaeochromogenes]|uniref:caspase, EACC1-associated type n=1 Tax=Streptomyces phaeochromogenes TaxID=1923 RepID=UPI00386AFA25|nr:caspase family protein [Streptomyces phaeochromogenes]